ncbi:MAG: hypothetical protein M3Y64_08500, partial [Gemmatimonadota bacterium]|nr:hypothetical protein [Gemmatimonadota bacterium]
MSPSMNESTMLGTDLATRVGAVGGQTVVNAGSPLTRLNYFDGKFLRADDFKREQNYVRQLVQFSNQGLGAGVVYGMDTVIDRQGRLNIGPGLAIDSSGRTLLVGANATLDINALIDATRRVTAIKGIANDTKVRVGGADFADCVDMTGNTDLLTAAGSLYAICVGHAESLCGTEDVYGRLCEDACVTATDRPLIVEGVVVRALPLTLRTPLATSKAVTLLSTHLRSLVASAYFEDERHVVPSIISRAGLALETWCVGAEMSAVGCVPLAVIGRAGVKTTFLDAWTVRRERMEAPAKRYWAWRMSMRPWDAFLAQVLQFQCQLHDLLDDSVDSGNNNPCEPQQTALNAASKYLRDFATSYTSQISALATPNSLAGNAASSGALFNLQGGVAELTKLRASIDGALKNIIGGPATRVIINGGIVELPSAGYLPVVPGTLSVNDQVRRLLGEGLNLRFCIVRPDYVPHALEEAQHMERISLLTGLDSTSAKPDVDILVPNGDILTNAPPAVTGFDTQVRLLPAVAGSLAGNTATSTGAVTGATNNNLSVATTRQLVVHGAGRADTANGAAAFHFAGAQEVQSLQQVVGMVNSLREFSGANTKKRETLLRDALRNATDIRPIARDANISSELLSSIALQPNFSGLLASASASIRKPVVGMWATARSERNPFALGVAESTPMSVEFALTTQVTTANGENSHLLTRVRAFATFSVTQAALAGATGLRMTGHMSGTYTTQVFADASTPGDTTKPFEVNVTLLRTGDAASGTMRATVGNADAGFGWLADASWGGTPLEATFKLSVTTGQKLQDSGLPATLEVLSVSALASGDALAEGGALRQLSTASLSLIGEELTRANQNGTSFIDVAQRLL